MVKMLVVVWLRLRFVCLLLFYVLPSSKVISGCGLGKMIAV